MTWETAGRLARHQPTDRRRPSLQDLQVMRRHPLPMGHCRRHYLVAAEEFCSLRPHLRSALLLSFPLLLSLPFSAGGTSAHYVLEDGISSISVCLH